MWGGGGNITTISESLKCRSLFVGDGLVLTLMGGVWWQNGGNVHGLEHQK